MFYAALVSFAALFAVYAYLPLAASRGPVISWGDPRSLEEIWWHVTGRQYQVFFSFSPKEIGVQFVNLVEWLSRIRLAVVDASLPCLGLAGFGRIFKRDRTTFWFLLVVGANLIYGLGYSIAEDKDAYCLPTFAAIAIAAGLGCVG